MRFAPRHRRRQVYLGIALIAEGNVTSRITAHQRVVENRPSDAVRGSWYPTILSRNEPKPKLFINRLQPRVLHRSAEPLLSRERTLVRLTALYRIEHGDL
jgi:hypothetical protein